MKRELEQQQQEHCNLIAIPPDIAVEIARLDQWQCSGAFARCSKLMLSAFTTPSILREIVHSLRESKRRILRWLTLALPSTLVSSASLPLIPWRRLTTLVESMFSHVTSLGGLEAVTRSEVFLSGGALCRIIYDREWQSDVDLFLSSPSLNGREFVSHPDDTGPIDLIPARISEAERVIEQFDLSLVQQGILGDGVYYTTVMALYSYTQRDIVVMPRVSNIWYPIDDDGSKISITDDQLWAMVDPESPKWREWHEDKVIHAVDNWRFRLKRFSDRFPDFKVRLCRPPLIATGREIKQCIYYHLI
jgi:hypothetical protein